MLNRCVNPACRTEFKLFNSGTLYAHERRSADTEFFWLCAPCHLVPCLGLDGLVSVMPRAAVGSVQPPHPDASIRIVARPMPRVPWRSAVPAGEAIPSVHYCGLSRIPPTCEAA
jgi:hypothetical protein